MTFVNAPAAIGRFRLERRLGAGGFATVWLARDDELDSLVAVKVLADNWAGEADIRRRFVDEARLLRRVDSDHLVRVYDIGELPDGRPWFVMTYADGGTLAERLDQHPAPWPAEVVVELIDAVSDGLTVLHRHGIVHRDVKPRNILLRSAPGAAVRGGRPGDGRALDRALLGDLGIAKDLQWASGLTMPVGSDGYMPPEQRTYSADIGPASDVYALAMTAGRLLALTPPWPATPLGQVLSAATHPDPSERTATAAEFARTLRAALTPWLHAAATAPAPPVAATPPMPPAPPAPASRPELTGRGAPSPRPRHRWRRRAAAAVIALALAAGARPAWALATTRPLSAADDKVSVRVPRGWQGTAGAAFPGTDDATSGARAGAGGRTVTVAFDDSDHEPNEVYDRLGVSGCGAAVLRPVAVGPWQGQNWRFENCAGDVTLDEVVLANPGATEWTVWLEVRSRDGDPDLTTILASLQVSP
ncbi:MAG: serine/threonine-protein kinase [Kineosporiaceae bacterium]